MSILILSACGPALAWTDLDKQQLVIGDGIAVVPTQYGAVQGYIMRDVYTFMGIPYGHETSGSYRLNSLGYSDFAAVGGEKYLHSGNVGMLDIVMPCCISCAQAE